MIIKLVDDNSQNLTILNDLLRHPFADYGKKKRIEQEIRNIQAGMRGEAEAAYEMKIHYGDTENWMIVHDLRIEHSGLVAQIDHLLINRFLEFWVCESKHFSEGVSINDHGEFTAFYGGNSYGVASPIEQNNRHIKILSRLLASGIVDLPKRLGFTIRPDFKSLVLVSKRARINRPTANIDGIECIIKNEMLVKTIDKYADKTTSALALAKVVSTGTLENLAHAISRLHRPIEFNWHAKFGLENIPQEKAALFNFPSNNHAGVQEASRKLPAKEVFASQSNISTAAPEEKQKLICNSCGKPVPYVVAKFCWGNRNKFGGNIFCRECQN